MLYRPVSVLREPVCEFVWPPYENKDICICVLKREVADSGKAWNEKKNMR